MKFEDKILNLIYSKSEGGYWDFKRSWHVDDGCLLHDIMILSIIMCKHSSRVEEC